MTFLALDAKFLCVRCNLDLKICTHPSNIEKCIIISTGVLDRVRILVQILY